MGWGIKRTLAVWVLALAAMAGAQNRPMVALDKPLPELPTAAYQAAYQNAIPLKPDYPLTVAVSLNYRDAAGMQAYVDAVSNPSNPLYRQFLTPEEVGARFGPSADVIEQVRSYLLDHKLSIQLVGKNGLTIIAEGTTAQIEAAFQTQLVMVGVDSQSANGNQTLYANRFPISVPTSLRRYIIDVSGLENVNRPQRRSYMTPPLAQALYGATPLFASNSKGQGRTIGISNWDGFRLSNVPPFLSQYGLPVPAGGAGSNIQVRKIDGGSQNGTQQGEADLDIQTVLGVAPLCNVIVYDGLGGNLINVLTREANDNVADIITESWGWRLDSNSKLAAHNLHLSMSAQGITYMAASGDTGTNLSYPYPNIEPEVLMVGGTTTSLTSQGARIAENGWSGSGGGWVVTTDTFNTRPAYQQGTGVPNNINYRMLPDVALNADPASGYVIYYNTGFYVFGGTSAASPTFAGCLADAQQQLIKNGALPASGGGVYRMGRIQDLIYSLNGNSSIFFDVISGANGNLPNGVASRAGSGWDFVTGWGAMDFSAFTTHMSGSGLATFTITPGAVEGGYANATATVSMVGLAPAGGFPVQITGGDSSISYPGTVTIPAGSGSVTFTITTSVVNTSVTETLTATAGSKTKTATLTLNPTSVSSLAITPATAPGGTTFSGTVTLARNASGAGVPVTLSGGDSNVTYLSTVTVPAGARTVSFQVTSKLVDANVTENLTATLGSSSARASLVLTPITLVSLSFAPNPVTSGLSVTGTITLSAAVGVPVTVAISGGDSNVSYPATVTVPANAKTATFTVGTSVVFGSVNETLSATYGSSVKTGSFTLKGLTLSTLTFNPGTIYGGQSSTGTITLSQATGPAGATISLSGGDSSISYPATVTVPAGASRATFTVTSSTISTIVTETLRATVGASSVSGALIVRPTGIVSSLTFTPTSLPGGLQTVGTIKLDYGAGPGGLIVSLSGGDSSISYPSTVTIPAGGSSATFKVNTVSVAVRTVETLTARNGSVSKTGTFTLEATAITDFTVSPTTVYGGQSLTGTITLNGPAAAAGTRVNLAGGDAKVSYPASVTVPAGATRATFTITTSSVPVVTNETLTATCSVVKSAAFVIRPAGIVAALTFSPSSLPGGLNTVGTLKLAYPAGPGGVTVALTGGDSNVSYPATVSLAAGASSTTFTVRTTPVNASTPEVLTATLGTSSTAGAFTLVATTLTGFTVAPTTVYGGQTVTGTLTLNGPAGASGAEVTIGGGDSAVTYPQKVTVPAGATGVTFAIATNSVLSIANESMSATFGATKSASFVVRPNGILTGLTFSPTSTPGGPKVVGTLKLSYPAGPGGVSVALSGGDASISYPSTVTVGAGASTATFNVTTFPVAAGKTETLQARLGPSTATGSFSLLANALSTFAVSPTSAFGGQNVIGTVTLNGPAPTGGSVVNLSGGDSNISYSTTVTVPAGASAATFTIRTSPVTVAVNETITASLGIARSATFSLKPAGVVSGLSFNPSTSVGGVSVVGTIKLSGPSGPSGVTVALTGGDSSISYPATVLVPPGAVSVNFNAALSPVSTSTLETLTATISPSSAQGRVTIVPPSLSNFTVAPSAIKGGANATGTVTLTGKAGPGGCAVTLSGGDGRVTFNTTVTVPAGASSATFIVSSSAVTQAVTVNLTARMGAISKSASLKLNP